MLRTANSLWLSLCLLFGSRDRLESLYERGGTDGKNRSRRSERNEESGRLGGKAFSLTTEELFHSSIHRTLSSDMVSLTNGHSRVDGHHANGNGVAHEQLPYKVLEQPYEHVSWTRGT